MAGPAHGRLRRSVGIVAGLICAATLAGSPAIGLSSRPLRVIQMNLCNSGSAGCYTGRSVIQAAAVIRAETPDLVTLNEVCENDVDQLVPALARAQHGGTVISAFQAAVSRRTGGVVRCRNGSPYGVGILAYVPGPDHGYLRYGGVYPMQEARGEERVWLCLDATAAFYACTTHLADDTASVALAQCEYLLNTAIPAGRASGEKTPTLIGGDLNLSPTTAQPCLPPGYTRRDDGGVQQIMATTDLVILSSKTIDMRGATDHPSLVVALKP